MSRMHPKTEQIWRRHEEWRGGGGDGALKAIQDANLIACINQGLSEAEGDAQAEGYKRGYRAGHAAGFAEAVRVPEVPVPPDPEAAPEAS